MLTRLREDVHEMLTEQIEYRELLAEMTRRDLLLRYKQTVMGFGWAIFMPLLNTVIFSVVFTRVAPLETGMPYPLYAYCGLLTWNFFASSLRFAVSSLTANTSLVTKVYFPREIFPFSAVVVCMVDFAVGAIPLVILMAYYGVGISAAILFLPVVVAVQLAFTLGVALLLAMANLFYRDIKYLFDVIVTLWMFATSVLYPISLAGGWVAELLKLNPMTPIIEAYRAVLLGGHLPAAMPFAFAAIVACSTLAVAWVIFHRAEFQFAESI